LIPEKPEAKKSHSIVPLMLKVLLCFEIKDSVENIEKAKTCIFS
jgi:hypothetical protein